MHACSYSVVFFAVVFVSSCKKSTVAVEVKDSGSSDYDLASYVQDCRDALGEIPAFNCLEGTAIKMFDPDRGRFLSHTDVGADSQCDAPSLLRTDLQSRLTGINPCVPFTRVGVSAASSGFTTKWVWSCRRYYPRPEQHPKFDDINMIGHNPKTGATCFFVSSINRSRPTETMDNGHDGRQVPSPADPIVGGKFWKSPREMTTVPALLGGSQPCVDCHDNDPFVHSPFIRQVKDGEGRQVVPSYPDGKYFVVGRSYFRSPKWELKVLASPEASPCTDCHRIGSRRTCADLMTMSVGLSGSRFLTAKSNNAAWMPAYDEEFTFSHERLDEESKKAVQFIGDCCRNHAAPGCRWVAPPH